VSVDNFGALLERLYEAPDSEITRREAAARKLSPSHFTYQGTLDQIRRFLVNGTGDLRCRVPPLGTRGPGGPWPNPVTPKCRAY